MSFEPSNVLVLTTVPEVSGTAAAAAVAPKPRAAPKCGHCRLEGHTKTKCPTKPPAAAVGGAGAPPPSAKSLAASEGNAWETTFANVRMENPEIRARFRDATGCGEVLRATPAGLERNATDVKVEGTLRAVNCQIKSSKGAEFNGQWHNCGNGESFYPTDPSITKRVTDHVRLTVKKGEAKPTNNPFSDEETKSLIRHIMAGDKPDHEPHFLVVAFDRGRTETEEIHIGPMNKVIEWMTARPTPKEMRMPVARKHGTINLCGQKGSLEGLTIQRRGGGGKHSDGTSKGNADAIQVKFKIKKGSELLTLFTKLS
jgi:hypothetical protein